MVHRNDDFHPMISRLMIRVPLSCQDPRHGNEFSVPCPDGTNSGFCFIPLGAHVPFFALRNYIDLDRRASLENRGRSISLV